MNKDIIILEDVCFSYSYSKNMILKHLYMRVKANCICFIMGINGSGKTTLLKNLMGFLKPQSGKIMINGIDVSNSDKNKMSKLISYVPQAIHLNTDFSVLDYLSLGRTPYIKLFSKFREKDYQLIDKYSYRFGINSMLDIPFNKLSGGQKQIVALAKSLIQDTPVMILDEPMSALDIGKQIDLLKVFHELIHEGKTIIVTTHNPIHALAIDSQACFINQGNIMIYGNSADIINEEMLKKIYGKNIMLLLDHMSIKHI